MRTLDLPPLRSRPALIFLCCLAISVSLGTWLFSGPRGFGVPYGFDTKAIGWNSGREGDLGSQGEQKETAATWLRLYDSLVGDLKAAELNGTHVSTFCTPIIEEGQVQVRLNEQDVDQLGTLEAVTPHILAILASCSAPNPGLGDFYETQLETPHYRSRIKINPPCDGSGRFVGEPLVLPLEVVGQEVRLRVWRLYRAYEAILLDHEIEGEFEKGPGPFARELVVDTTLVVIPSTSKDVMGTRPPCQTNDFDRVSWTGGYWYRHELTDESWSFELPHCTVKKFTQEEASECLDGRWIGFLGDSTQQDMMRNTLWTFLGNSYPFPDDTPLPKDFERSMDVNITHPGHPERWTRMSLLFNGHYWLEGNRLGMNSFRHQVQIDRHDKYFAESLGVDTFIINSGLHDAWNRPTPQAFMDDFQFGWEYYMRKLGETRKGAVPKIVYRFSVTPPVHLDNYAKATPMNPASLDMINLLEADYLEAWLSRQARVDLSFLDSYEITWSWHFDGETNDGPHYGRAPWQAGDQKKFVDDMMVRIFLNDIC